ncbi:MAG: type II secretion system minor pseudopilin GspK [candidate division NC10 bacterium]|nr:type II secretion system minor pseudopilin GspK [candidate division NC10 bacterium]
MLQDKGRPRRPAVLKEAHFNSRGLALILTLCLLAIITAMVVEFSYGVYISTQSLHNWQACQRLSFVARSGLRLASTTISQNARERPYTYPGASEVLYGIPFKDLEGNLSLRVRIEDEDSKFNISSLVYANGILNSEAVDSLVRLLEALNLNPKMADRMIDWIDPDREPRLPDSEKGAKNQNLDSVDEIFLIPGIDRGSCEKLLPYITIYGDGLVNINGAEVPVLMSLSPSIDKGMAERIVQFRESRPFERAEDILKVAGFEALGPPLMGRLTVKGTAFRVISTGSEGEVKRIIESVLESSGGKRMMVRYWKEM